MTPYPYTKSGRVHDGFLSTYDIFRKRIIDTLAPISAGKRLYITGHSLGAALATLAIPDVISATPYRSPYAYTYGSPRVGDRDFVAAYNGMMKNRSFRIVNTSDPIVSVPFPAPFLGFLGGYFTHVDMPVDFTVQEENMEKNHGMKTYRTALAGVRRKGLFGYLWR